MTLYWQATHSTGLILNQFQGAKYGDIDRSTLEFFDLWIYPDRGPGIDPHLLVRVDLRADSLPQRRLIWRKRTERDMSGNELVYHLVGWQRTVEGRNVQAICYVFNESTVVLGGEWQEHDPVMFSVPNLECELI